MTEADALAQARLSAEEDWQVAENFWFLAVASLGSAWRGAARLGRVRPGIGMVRLGAVWRGPAWRGVVRQGMESAILHKGLADCPAVSQSPAVASLAL